MSRGCQRKWEDGKQCTEPPRHFPVLILHNEREELIARCLLNLPVCELHRQILTVECFVSDTGWAQIVAAMRRSNREAPVRAYAYLEFEAMA